MPCRSGARCRPPGVSSASASSSSSSPGRPPPLPSRLGAVISGRYWGPPWPRQWRATSSISRIGDQHALQAHRARRVDRLVEHVAAAEQVLGAGRVQDGAAVDAGGHGEGDAARDVGLDQAGDDLDRWPLGGDHEVDAGRPRQLGDAGDRRLDLVGADHHQVGQLVDDDDDVRHPRLAGAQRLVVAGDVADAALRELVVAALHGADRPLQGVDRLVGVDDHLGQQVRNALVLRQLDPLRVDQDQLHLGRAWSSSGSEPMMALTHTLLPDPVAPAMRRCGILARSALNGWPATSWPRAKASLLLGTHRR